MNPNFLNSTKTFSDTNLPKDVLEIVATLSIKHSVDLNSIKYLGGDCYLIGEARTGLTIFANNNDAYFASVDMEVTNQGVDELKNSLKELIGIATDVYKGADAAGMVHLHDEIAIKINKALASLGKPPRYKLHG